MELLMVVLENCRRRLGPGVEFFCDRFEAAEGDMVALWGPSGCGKSTMLNMVSGLLRPDSGTVTVGGTELTKLTDSGLDRFRGEHFGFVFQTFNLLAPFTALQNVMLGMRFSDTRPDSEWKPRAMELLERVGLGHRMHSKPATMSVGERQRVAIARALANKQRVIAADEPTGSLDPRTAAGVMKLLLELCKDQKVTMLLVTHDRTIADNLPRVFECTDLVKDAQS
jgi:ABC-type lipoprotein export system ATPase subunit